MRSSVKNLKRFSFFVLGLLLAGLYLPDFLLTRQTSEIENNYCANERESDSFPVKVWASKFYKPRDLLASI